MADYPIRIPDKITIRLSQNKDSKKPYVVERRYKRVQHENRTTFLFSIVGRYPGHQQALNRAHNFVTKHNAELDDTSGG